jgi:hypothetical protein
MSTVRIALVVFLCFHIAYYLKDERYAVLVDRYDSALYQLLHRTSTWRHTLCPRLAFDVQLPGLRPLGANMMTKFVSRAGFGLIPAGKQARPWQPQSGTFHNDVLLEYLQSAMDYNSSNGLFMTRTLIAHMTPGSLLASRPVMTRLMAYTLIEMPRTLAPAAVAMQPSMGLIWFLDKQMPAIDLKRNATEAMQVCHKCVFSALMLQVFMQIKPLMPHAGMVQRCQFSLRTVVIHLLAFVASLPPSMHIIVPTLLLLQMHWLLNAQDDLANHLLAFLYTLFNHHSLQLFSLLTKLYTKQERGMKCLQG